TTMTFSLTYTLSLHDALPIFRHDLALIHLDVGDGVAQERDDGDAAGGAQDDALAGAVDEPASQNVDAALFRSLFPREAALLHQRSEEHTSELQSLAYLVCRLL